MFGGRPFCETVKEIKSDDKDESGQRTRRKIKTPFIWKGFLFFLDIKGQIYVEPVAKVPSSIYICALIDEDVMPRFKNYNYQQTIMIPVCLEDQISEGTLEFVIHYLLEHEIDLSIFDEKFNNDDTGCPAYDPKILLKIILWRVCVLF